MDTAVEKNMAAKTTLLSVVFLAIVSLVLRSKLDLAGHMDEYDYLFVGKTLLSGDDWPTLTYIFGSNFNWYLLGWGDQTFGGLSGARIVAGICGMFSLVFTWLIAHQLWKSRTIATVAMLILALSPPHIYISRLATYDIISFALFTASMYVLLLGCQTEKHRLFKMIAGVLLFTAAVLSKYVVLLFIPFVGLIMLTIAPGLAVISGVLLCIFLTGYFIQNQSELLILYQNQIVAVHGANAERIELLLIILPYLIVPLALWFVGIGTVSTKNASNNRTSRPILFASLFLSMPLLAYHFYGSNMISLYKHTVHTVFFLAPVGAWVVVTQLSRLAAKRASSYVAPVAALLLAGISVAQLKTIENGYPDVRNLLEASIETLPQETTILSEDPYLFRYVLYNSLEQDRINEAGWLDFNGDGLHKPEDVILALENRHFEFVFLNDQINPAGNAAYREVMANRNYIPVYTENYELSNKMTKNQIGSMTLYRRQNIQPASLLNAETDSRDL